MSNKQISKKDILGTWKCVSYLVIREGKTNDWTEATTGHLIYSEPGYMAAVLNHDHKQIRPGDKVPDRTTLCYAGPFEVSAEGVITHHVKNCSDSSWIGRALERFPSWNEKGNLVLKAEGGMGTGIITWERIS